MRFRVTFKPSFMVFQALIAAIYVVLALLLHPISFGNIQFRVSEALTVLPFFSPFSVIGISLGCFIANIFGGNGILDVILGTFATVIAGVCTAKIRKDWLAPLPPVLINAVVIGAMLAYLYAPDTFWISFAIFGAEVGIGQICACYVLGLPLIKLLRRYGKTFKGRFGLWIDTKDV